MTVDKVRVTATELSSTPAVINATCKLPQVFCRLYACYV